MITRWQAARGYPKSGYLNTLQHKALLTEIVAVAPTASSGSDDRPKRADRQRRSRRSRGRPRRRHSASYSGGGGPDPAGAGRFIGGVVGGMLR